VALPDKAWANKQKFDTWKVMKRSMSSFGTPIVNITCEGGGGKSPSETFNTLDRSKMMTVVFPIDPEKPPPGAPPPHFLSEPKSDKKGHVDVCLRVPDEGMLAYFDALDGWALSAGLGSPDVFFPSAPGGGGRVAPPISEESLRAKFKSSVHAKDGFQPYVKAKLYVTGPKWLITDVTIVDGQQQRKGRGWEFLRDNMGPEKMLNYYATPVVTFRGFSVGRNDFSVRLDVEEILFVRNTLDAEGAGRKALDSVASFFLQEAASRESRPPAGVGYGERAES
jgi:hypothetical protein